MHCIWCRRFLWSICWGKRYTLCRPLVARITSYPLQAPRNHKAKATSMTINYDALASDYINYRIPDARIASAIRKHIPAGSRVLNVGAGQGSYEPENCNVVALEPSREMISRRPPDKRSAIRGLAESMPFADNCFDISLAILTIHHWHNIQKGLSEMKRVTCQKTIILTWNGDFGDFWLPDYFPEIAHIDTGLFPSIHKICGLLSDATEIDIVEIPHDCTDGFMCAYWRRPKTYLNTAARNAISTFSRLNDLDDGLKHLQSDIESGVWRKRYSSILQKDKLDCGYRLLISNL